MSPDYSDEVPHKYRWETDIVATYTRRECWSHIFHCCMFHYGTHRHVAKEANTLEDIKTETLSLVKYTVANSALQYALSQIDSIA